MLTSSGVLNKGSVWLSNINTPWYAISQIISYNKRIVAFLYLYLE